MSEPTAEQVDEILMELGFGEHRHARPTGVVALRTALARVRIEAHAAGRDEAIDRAADIANVAARAADDMPGGATVSLCLSLVERSIRALRGRT